MRLWITAAFAILTSVLYALSATIVLWNAMNTPGYSPNDAQSTVYGLTSGAIVAFLVAQLGLAVGNSETGASDSLKAAVSGDPSKGRGDLILGSAALVFVLVGLWYITLWLIPSLIAPSPAAKSVTQAPDFIGLQAKAFLGILIAGFTAVAGAAGGSSTPSPPPSPAPSPPTPPA